MADLRYRRAIARFQSLYKQWQRSKPAAEPTAMTLATAAKNGRVAARTVLLKEADERGFVFFTNLESRKGRHLKQNRRVALCFYWPSLNRQVLVDGTVTPVSTVEADAYWCTRPRLSQLGAWASLQSHRLPSRGALLKRVAKFRKQFGSGPIPRPKHWSGFRVLPDRIEFWRLGAYRLHQRTVYEKSNGRWTEGLLYP